MLARHAASSRPVKRNAPRRSRAHGPAVREALSCVPKTQACPRAPPVRPVAPRSPGQDPLGHDSPGPTSLPHPKGIAVLFPSVARVLIGASAAVALAVAMSPRAMVAMPADPPVRAAIEGSLAPAAARDLAVSLGAHQLKLLGVPAADARRIASDAAGTDKGQPSAARLSELALAAESLADTGSGGVARDVVAVVHGVATSPSGVLTADRVARVLGYDLPPEAAFAHAATAPASSVGVTLADSRARVGGTCLTCPAFDFGPFTPTTTYQLHGSDLSTPTDCNWYAFDVQSGSSYEFTTCSPGSATFDTVLDLFSPSCGFLASNDDACGAQSRITWTATLTGSVRLKVRGFGGATGSYVLAYRRVCIGSPDCNAPDATLAAPTTACQYASGNVSDCTDARFYSVTLVQGQTYTFTLCPATCSGASASFDSAVELHRGGTLLASDSSACGDDGEVVYTTNSMTGGGTYCVVVRREAGGTADFVLGYRVACQAPSALAIVPDRGSTAATDCSRLQTFTATSGGTGPFTWSWSIAPQPGDSATPASGTGSTATGLFSFDSLLVGAGAYTVTVDVTNECGSTSRTITFVLEDRAGPVLTPTAETASCGAPITSPRRHAASSTARAASQLASLDADQVALLLAEPDPEVVRQALADKLGVRPKSISVLDSRVPGVVSPPGTHALGCGSPCTGFSTLQASNPFYEVFLNCGDGAFTARTGPAHSVTLSSGSAQNVIFGGQSGSPGTSDVSWYVHQNGTHYIDPTGGAACLFNPADTPAEPANVGIEAEWTRTPLPGVTLTLREEIVAFGDTEDNSGVRLTLGATNQPASTSAVTMGVRWQIDYQNAGDDGPLIAGVRCQPFDVFDQRSLEHEYTAAEIDALDFYRIQNNSSSPIFGNFTSTTEIFGFPNTGKPDRLVYARWGAAVGSGWNYPTSEGASGPDSDSAVLYYFGFTAGNGISIAPGESFTRSVIIFTAGDAQDCGTRRPGECDAEASVEICPGECARIGATATDACGTVVVDLVASTPGAPTCVGNPCTMLFPDEGTFVYTWRATDEAGNEVECTSTVVVANGPACNEPPTCTAGGPYTGECRAAAVDGAVVDDPDGDPITFTWTSSNPLVTVVPASGVAPGAPGARPLPPVVAMLDAAVDPCGASSTLTLTVNDGRGGISSCTTVVTFVDDLPPALVGVPGDQTVECDAVPSPAPVTAVDGCDAAPALGFSETRVDGDCPGRYTLTRTWTATDHCGNATSRSQVMTVVDTTPPEITVLGGGLAACLWPPNHWYVPFRLEDLALEVRDACSEPVSVRISGCVSDQPDDAPERRGSGEWNGDGHTVNDCVVSDDGQTVHVRSERCGAGPTAQDGRRYGIAVVAVDACGNESAPVLAGTIHVPHDQSPAARDCVNPTKVGCRELPCRR